MENHQFKDFVNLWEDIHYHDERKKSELITKQRIKDEMERLTLPFNENDTFIIYSGN